MCYDVLRYNVTTPINMLRCTTCSDDLCVTMYYVTMLQYMLRCYDALGIMMYCLLQLIMFYDVICYNVTTYFKMLRCIACYDVLCVTKYYATML